MKAMTIRLDDHQARMLEGIARADSLPVAQLVREAIGLLIEQRLQDAGFQKRVRRAFEADRELLGPLTREDWHGSA
jgi:predicted transcriptional regulator